MKTIIKTEFNTSFDKSVEFVFSSKLLEFVCFPILKFKTVDIKLFPKKWSDGDKIDTKIFFLGFLPLGNQKIDISTPKVSEDICIIRDNGSGNLVKTWDHTITIRKLSKDKILYEDSVEVKAGILTIPTWVFANLFYRWRQYRWSELIKKDFKQIR